MQKSPNEVSGVLSTERFLRVTMACRRLGVESSKRNCFLARRAARVWALDSIWLIGRPLALIYRFITKYYYRVDH